MEKAKPFSYNCAFNLTEMISSWDFHYPGCETGLGAHYFAVHWQKSQNPTPVSPTPVLTPNSYVLSLTSTANTH